MNGILALWHRDGAPLDPALPPRMAMALEAPAGAAALHAVSGTAALGGRRRDPGTEPGLPASDGVLLSFDGRLDEPASLAAALGADPALPDAALVLAAYRRWGIGSLEHLVGDYALALFDPAAPRLLLARDVVGMRPLHWIRQGERFLAASQVKALLAHPAVPARPSLAHLAEYLVGAAPADDAGMTFFEGIETVPPGCLVSIERDRVERRRFADLAHGRIRHASFADYREDFAARFDRAVRRRLRGDRPVAVSVSGGVDSSAVFCAALALRAGDPALPAVEGLTEAHPGDPCADEVEYVEAIERRYRVGVHRLPGGGLGDLESWRRQVWHSEIPAIHPFAAATEARVGFAASLGARVLLGGEWADATMFDQTYLVDLARRGAWGTLQRHLRAIPRWFQDADPRPFREQFVRDLARLTLPGPVVGALRRLRPAAGGEHESLFGRARALRGFPRAPEQPAAGLRFPSEQARSLFGRVRARRAALDLGTLSRSTASAGIDFAFPYLDPDLLALVIGIPGQVLAPDGVPKGLLREAMRGRMPDSIVERRWKADFTHLVADGLSRYFVTLSGYLRANTASVDLGLVDGDALRDALDRWAGQRLGPERIWILLQLLGLELWLQAYPGGGTPNLTREPS